MRRFLLFLSLLLFAFLVLGVRTTFGFSPSPQGLASYVPDEIVVKFKGDKKPFRVIKVSQGRVRERVIEYQRKREVEYVEPNYIAYSQWAPNDPYYKYQWHLDNPVYGGIQMEKAWELSAGAGVTVAIVDTGIRKGTDLASTCFVPGWDYVNNDNDPIDDNGHGTHVAGTVAQSTNNNLGIAGVAYESCLMPVKVLDSQGSGTYTQVADGIYYAADNGAKVINLSLGGSPDSTTLKNAVAYAYSKGVTVVAACGNDNQAVCLYPAAYDDYVIAVGAVQYDETKAPYSNYGPSLDLVAPGGNNDLDQNKDGYGDGILQQTFTINRGLITWGYYFFQGTSMATPHVAGAVALVIAKGNAATPDEVRAILQGTAKDLGTTSVDETYGWGLVNAAVALGTVPTPTSTPTPTPTLEPEPTPTSEPEPTPTSEPEPTPTPTPTLEPTPTPVSDICWSGDYQYLYRSNIQARKFCKCASGIYGYNSYASKVLRRAKVYRYADTGDNENWNTTSILSNLPVYQVVCTDGAIYPTNQDYSWPK